MLHLGFVIRTERNLRAFRNQSWDQAERGLKQEWAVLRRAMKRHRFGRHRLSPVRKNRKGLALYLCKYLTKTVSSDHPDDRGGHAVRIPARYRVVSCDFSWVAGRPWRGGLRRMARALGLFGVRIEGVDGFNHWFGDRWAHKLRGLVELLAANEIAGLHDLQIAKVCAGI